MANRLCLMRRTRDEKLFLCEENKNEIGKKIENEFFITKIA